MIMEVVKDINVEVKEMVDVHITRTSKMGMLCCRMEMVRDAVYPRREHFP